MTSKNNDRCLIEFLGGINPARAISTNAPKGKKFYCTKLKIYGEGEKFQDQATVVDLPQLKDSIAKMMVAQVGSANAILVCSQLSEEITHIKYFNANTITSYKLTEAGPSAIALMLCDDGIWIPSSFQNAELEEGRFINMRYLRRGVELHHIERGQYLTSLKYPISVCPYYDDNEDINSYGSRGHHDAELFIAAVEAYDPDDDQKIIKGLKVSGEVRHLWHKKVPNKRFESVEVKVGSTGAFPVTIWGQF